MIIHAVTQGSPEWLALRSGIPTSSAFDRIVTPSGKPSASARKYMAHLLAEREMGRPLEEHVTLWMQRGKELEGEAVAWYEAQADFDTVAVGFITDDARTVGASPDRLVGEPGLLEIKAPKDSTHAEYLYCDSASVAKDHGPQIQGQLWISGREWVDIMSYHPCMRPALHRVQRDDAFIDALIDHVMAFSAELERRWAGRAA